MCAFLLPLIISIYRDSLVYGVELQNYHFHRGQTIHITGAQPEDLLLFQDIEGLTAPFFEDRTIYMNFDSQESAAYYQDLHQRIALNVLLNSKASQSGRAMEVLFYDVNDTMLDDEYMQTTLQNMRLANLFLLLFSGLIVQAACRNHLDSFSGELEELSAIGAGKGQLFRMFLAEQAFLFPLASVGAVGIAYAVMRLLYEKYLGNMAASTAIWRVFHMEIQNTALQIGFFLVICLAAMSYAFLKKPAHLQIGKLRKTASLPQLWMQRARPPFLSCLAILVPLAAAFVILFNQYLGTYAKMVYSSQNATMIVQTPRENFSQKELDAVSGIRAVSSVELTWDFSEPYMLAASGQEPIRVAVNLTDEVEKHQIIANLPASMDGEDTYYFYRITNPENAVAVTPVRQMEQGTGEENTSDVYVSAELMKELVRGYNQLVVHTAPDQASTVEEELRRSLDASIDIANFQNYVDTTILQQQGHLWLLSWIFCILMLAAMQIIWARLSRYVWDCAPMLQIIRQVGASSRQVAGLIPVRYGAVPAALLPFLIAIPWAWLDARRSGRPLVFSALVFGIYLVIAVLAAVTFWLPIRISLKRIQKAR